MSAPTEEYKPSSDAGAEAPTGADTTQDDYRMRPGQKEVPVQSDDAPVDDPIDAKTADSDEQLARDDTDAIDEGNIVDGRTRGAGPAGGYREPGDEEGLPTDDGTSST